MCGCKDTKERYEAESRVLSVVTRSLIFWPFIIVTLLSWLVIEDNWMSVLISVKLPLSLILIYPLIAHLIMMYSLPKRFRLEKDSTFHKTHKIRGVQMYPAVSWSGKYIKLPCVDEWDVPQKFVPHWHTRNHPATPHTMIYSATKFCYGFNFYDQSKRLRSMKLSKT